MKKKKCNGIINGAAISAQSPAVAGVIYDALKVINDAMSHGNAAMALLGIGVAAARAAATDSATLAAAPAAASGAEPVAAVGVADPGVQNAREGVVADEIVFNADGFISSLVEQIRIIQNTLGIEVNTVSVIVMLLNAVITYVINIAELVEIAKQVREATNITNTTSSAATSWSNVQTLKVGEVSSAVRAMKRWTLTEQDKIILKDVWPQAAIDNPQNIALYVDEIKMEKPSEVMETFGRENRETLASWLTMCV